jgi:hypothetical protein
VDDRQAHPVKDRYKGCKPRSYYALPEKSAPDTWSSTPEGGKVRSQRAASSKISTFACKRTSFLNGGSMGRYVRLKVTVDVVKRDIDDKTVIKVVERLLSILGKDHLKYINLTSVKEIENLAEGL